MNFPMDFIIYEIKTAVLFAVFYMFYRLLLSKETFHRLNRTVLLCSAMASALLPLCRITLHKTVEIPARLENTLDIPVIADIGQKGNAFPIDEAILLIFCVGAIMMLAKTAISVYSVMRIILRSKRLPQPDGTVIAVTQGNTAPFSWMKYIVISQKDWDDRHDEIIIHEKAHIRLCHSWDLLFIDLFTALQWFNPAIWMLRSDIRAIHEYEADREVLRSGINATQYQLLLIKKAVGMSGHSITNSFNHSTLKKRITMMSCKKSNFVKALRVLFAIPLIGICLIANARTDIDYVVSSDIPPTAADEQDGQGQASISITSYYTDSKDTQSSDDDKAIVIMKSKSGEYTMSITKDSQSENLVHSFSFIDDETGKTLQTLNLNELLEKKGIIVQESGNSTIITLTDEGLDENELFFDLTKNVRFQINGKDIQETKGHDVAIEGKPGTMYIVSDSDGEGIIINYSFSEQSGQDGKKYPLNKVEVAPTFQGGDVNSFSKWVMQNLKYPEDAIKNKTEGTVILQFTIDKSGKLVNPSIIKGVNESLDNEALRVVSKSPEWTPGMIDDKPVNVTFQFPLIFKLK